MPVARPWSVSATIGLDRSWPSTMSTASVFGTERQLTLRQAVQQALPQRGADLVGLDLHAPPRSPRRGRPARGWRAWPRRSRPMPLPCRAAISARGLAPLALNSSVPLRGPTPRGAPAPRGGARASSVASNRGAAGQLDVAGTLLEDKPCLEAASRPVAGHLLHVDLSGRQLDVERCAAETQRRRQRQARRLELDGALEAVEHGGVERLVRPGALLARQQPISTVPVMASR